MKKRFHIAFLLLATWCFGQNAANIQIPSSPATSIIGIENAEIATPGNYNGLTTSLLAPIVRSGGAIPSDLALEFSPYYLQSRDITVNEYLQNNWMRDLKFSLATNSVSVGDSATFSRIGFGFSTYILGGNLVRSKPQKDAIQLDYLNDISTVVTALESGFYPDLATANLQEIVADVRDSTLREKLTILLQKNSDDPKKAVQALKDFQEEIESQVVVDLSPYDYSLRTGHFLQIAGALATDFPTNDFLYSTISRWSVWLNYTFRPNKKVPYLDFAAILRFSNYSYAPGIAMQNQFYIDPGIRLNCRVPKTKFIISGEWMGKFALNNAENQNLDLNEQKWAANLAYQISENTMCSISLSQANGELFYEENGAYQFLLGLSAAFVGLKN